MGRKALPANVHLINGNPSKKRMSVLSDGSRVPVSIPKMPKHLDAGAKREWKSICSELEKLGLIADVDRAVVAMYCVVYSRWEYAETKIKEMKDDVGLIERTPNLYKQISVWLQIANRCMEQLKGLIGEIGMSPSARARVKVTLQQDLFGDDSSIQTKTNPADQYFRPR
jgi:P27 family predicted phage terminase small subunit